MDQAKLLTQMKILLTGKDGQLGQELSNTSPTKNLFAFDINKLDITNFDQVESIIHDIKPDIIINTAAYTQVDQAETEQKKAFAINSSAVGHLAKLTNTHKIRLIHISTDYVFDGKKDSPYLPSDPVHPINIYGKSKASGEELILRHASDQSLIIRSSWLYSIHGLNFVKTMLRLMNEKNNIQVVNDQTGTPTWAAGLAKFIWHVLSQPRLKGIYHYSDGGETNWYKFASAIYQQARRLKIVTSDCNIQAVTSQQYPQAAMRPPKAVLDKTKTIKDTGIIIQDWKTNLNYMLQAFSKREDL